MLGDLPYKHWFCQPYIRPKVASSVNTIDNGANTCTETGACRRPLLDLPDNSSCKIAKLDIATPEQDLVVYPSIGITKLKTQRDEEKRRKKEARQICKDNANKTRSEALPCALCSCNMRVSFNLYLY